MHESTITPQSDIPVATRKYSNKIKSMDSPCPNNIPYITGDFSNIFFIVIHLSTDKSIAYISKTCQTQNSTDFNILAEKEGFEPSHAYTSAGFRNQSLQPLGYFSTNIV